MTARSPRASAVVMQIVAYLQMRASFLSLATVCSRLMVSFDKDAFRWTITPPIGVLDDTCILSELTINDK